VSVRVRRAPRARCRHGPRRNDRATGKRGCARGGGATLGRGGGAVRGGKPRPGSALCPQCANQRCAAAHTMGLHRRRSLDMRHAQPRPPPSPRGTLPPRLALLCFFRCPDWRSRPVGSPPVAAGGSAAARAGPAPAGTATAAAAGPAGAARGTIPIWAATARTNAASASNALMPEQSILWRSSNPSTADPSGRAGVMTYSMCVPGPVPGAAAAALLELELAILPADVLLSIPRIADDAAALAAAVAAEVLRARITITGAGHPGPGAASDAQQAG